MAFKDRLLYWVARAGKTLVILTEGIVLVVFVLRFYLDHKIATLEDSIEKKAEQISSVSDFEREFKYIQSKAMFYKAVSKQRIDFNKRISLLLKNTPHNITITNIDLTETTSYYTASTAEISEFSHLIENFGVEKDIFAVTLNDVSYDSTNKNYTFSVEVIIK